MQLPSIPAASSSMYSTNHGSKCSWFYLWMQNLWIRRVDYTTPFYIRGFSIQRILLWRGASWNQPPTDTQGQLYSQAVQPLLLSNYIIFSTLRNKPRICKQSLPILPSLQLLKTTTQLSVSMDLHILDVSYNESYKVQPFESASFCSGSV